jgi:hypothetical protein
MAIKLSKMTGGQPDADELSNHIQSLIGAWGFVLPFRFISGRGLSDNKMGLAEFLSLSLGHWPLLENKKIDLIVWDGDSEVTLSDVNTGNQIPRECIPLSFCVHGMSDKIFILPCLKTVLTSKPE